MTNRPDSHARSMLPIPDRPKFGHTTYDAKDPETNFPPIEPLLPPEGAPNVLIVLLDDVGFGASTAFGGPCATPNAEKLAAGGLSYNRFHTTALCSPTRAALITGRNHHSVATGVVVDQGSPGALIARYGRGNMEEVFLDIARGRADERVAGSAAEESTA